jgi:Fic family protein
VSKIVVYNKERKRGASMEDVKLDLLPPKADIETKKILRQLTKTHRALAELKGYSDTMPNKYILINAVTINEAKDSSEIENIITTHDDLFKAMVQENYHSPAAKEVVSYRTALWRGFEMVKKHGLLTTNMIIEIQGNIEKNRAGVRKLPGTVLKNESTDEVVYTPPSGEKEILYLMSNLEKYINDDEENVDNLIKLAVIHYQFESIHPFYDGNGRTGRIINVLYLVLKELLDSPILYLSKYIIRNKSAYYRLLQEIRTENNWEEWILYILKGIEQTAKETLELTKRINFVVEETAAKIKSVVPKIYSKELVDLLFYEFYTKINYIQKGLNISRKTASVYLASLENEGFLSSQMIGKEKVYLNKPLFKVVQDIGLMK